MAFERLALLSMTLSIMLLLSHISLASEACLKPTLRGIDQSDIKCSKINLNFYYKDKASTTRYSIFKQDQLYGIAKLNGDIIIPALYQEFGSDFFVNGSISVKREDKWGYLDIAGNEIVPMRYDWVAPYFIEDELADVTLAGKSGCINKAGETLIPIIYDGNGLCKFEGGYSVGVDSEWLEVSMTHNGEHRYGCVDRGNNIILPIRYNFGVCKFDDTKLNKQYNLVFDLILQKAGVIDKSANFVIPTIFDEISPVHLTPDNIENSVWRVRDKGKVGLINTQLEVIAPFKFDFIFEFHDGLAKVVVDNQIGYIDITGSYVIPLRDYTDASIFQHGMATVQLGEPYQSDWKFGLIDKTGKELLPIIYDYIEILNKNQVEITQGDKTFIITL